MSLFALSFAGGSFILIGAYESLSLSKTHRFNTITLISSLSLSLLFISHSLFSLFSSISSHDYLGPTLHYQTLSISSLFLIFSLLGLLSNLSRSHLFPYPLLNLLLFFAFVEEFLFFYLKLKDPDGIENRYFDLMLVPVSICVVSTLIELKCPDSIFPKLGRGLGLILQGTWFVQMGLSFYTDLIAHNCGLYQKSRGNYTIKCKGHMDAHRGGAIAVLLFNCHLAGLVAVITGFYAVFGSRFGGDYRSNYRPIGVTGEVQRRVEDQVQFSLDSDSDDGGGVSEIKQEEGNANGLRRENGGAIELAVNGYGSHR